MKISQMTFDSLTLGASILNPLPLKPTVYMGLFNTLMGDRVFNLTLLHHSSRNTKYNNPRMIKDLCRRIFHYYKFCGFSK